MEDKLFKDVLQTVSEVTDVSVKQIMSKCRVKEYADARRMISFILYHYGYTLTQIKKLLNLSCNSAVRYLIRTHDDLMHIKKYEYNYKQIKELLDKK